MKKLLIITLFLMPITSFGKPTLTQIFINKPALLIETRDLGQVELKITRLAEIIYNVNIGISKINSSARKRASINRMYKLWINGKIKDYIKYINNNNKSSLKSMRNDIIKLANDTKKQIILMKKNSHYETMNINQKTLIRIKSFIVTLEKMDYIYKAKTLSEWNIKAFKSRLNWEERYLVGE